MRYKTWVQLIYGSFCVALVLLGGPRVWAEVIKNPRRELGWSAAELFFLLLLTGPGARVHGMTPEQQDDEYARFVIGAGTGLQVVAAVFAVITFVGIVSQLRSGNPWDRGVGGACLFSAILFFAIWPLKRQARRHLLDSSPGRESPAIADVLSLWLQVVAAPTSLLFAALLLGQFEYGQGWNGGFAGACAIAGIIWYGAQVWRRRMRRRGGRPAAPPG